MVVDGGDGEVGVCVCGGSNKTLDHPLKIVFFFFHNEKTQFGTLLNLKVTKAMTILAVSSDSISTIKSSVPG